MPDLQISICFHPKILGFSLSFVGAYCNTPLQHGCFISLCAFVPLCLPA